MRRALAILALLAVAGCGLAPGGVRSEQERARAHEQFLKQTIGDARALHVRHAKVEFEPN